MLYKVTIPDRYHSKINGNTILQLLYLFEYYV